MMMISQVSSLRFFVILISIPLLLRLEVSCQCLGDQKSLLLELKNSLIFNTRSKSNLAQWNPSTDCCSWDGVSCDEGRVIALHLGGKSIIGGLDNSSLFDLRHLESLDLSCNSFSTPIPSRLGDLTNLSLLNLSNAGFVGQIPSFEMSKNLTKIVLSHNDLSGSIPKAHWEGLVKLLVVDLRNNSFSGCIPSSLFSLPSLEQIQLSSNRFTGLVPEFPDPSSLMLRMLDLSRNNLEGPIPMSIFKLSKLSMLSLAFNNLNSTVQQDSISSLAKLESLDLSYNKLSFNASGATLSFLPDNITMLNLAYCNLKTFPSLKNRPKLVSLDLSNNQIHGLIPNWIWEIGNGSLLHMNLSHNGLVGIQEPYSLPSTLYALDLNFNQIRGTIPVPPPSASYIDISSNHFHSSIPTDFGNNLSSVIFLSLSNNSLTGVVPESICNAIDLQVLDLSSNGLIGRIPEFMSTMSKSLVVLNLNGNRFSGQIPDSFPVNCALMTLDFNGNSIEGQVPKSLTGCRELTMLDLGNNNLTGELPCFLKNISALRVLVLRYNNFHGSIGCSNTSKTEERLQIIDLAHNNFSGELSRRSFENWNAMIDNEENTRLKLDHLLQVTVRITTKGREIHLVKILTVCTCIDFSSNRLHGPVPEDIGALTLLYSLNLSNNAFSGPIPSSFGDMRHLESLDLSRNKLSGTIPTSLANLNFLAYLNLSFNKLVGRIPSGSQLHTFSADSFSGNAGLCGFPSVSNCANDALFDSSRYDDSDSDAEINWDIISTEIGFAVGFGLVIGPLVLCKPWRKYYFQAFGDIAFRMLPFSVTRKWLLWTKAR